MNHVVQIVSENQNAVIVLFLEAIFGVSFSYLLGFFIKLALIFLGSAIISKLFHLDKVYERNNANMS